MKNRRTLSALLAFVLLTLSPAGLLAQAPQQIPPHPRELKYTTLTFTPPKREQYRHVLSNGVVAYLVEDHDLPLVNISTLVRTGTYLDPAGKEGVASAYRQPDAHRAALPRKRRKSLTRPQIFWRPTSLATSAHSRETPASNLLAKDVDQGLGLYFDMLKNPRFQEDRIKLAKSQLLQNMERRNDNTAGIEDREWNRLIYGAEPLFDEAGNESLNRRHYTRGPAGVSPEVLSTRWIHLRRLRRLQHQRDDRET